MVLEREYPSAWSGSRRSQGGKDRAIRVEKEVETAWNFIEWDIETRLPGFASFPSFNRETERERERALRVGDEVENDYSRILVIPRCLEMNVETRLLRVIL